MPTLTLLTADGNNIHHAGGLNWGFSTRAHVCKNDAYIPIHIRTIRLNPSFFPTRSSSKNNILKFTWDDGFVMYGKFEGTMTDCRTGNKYPKQLSSHPHKDILGCYIRNRIGIPLGQAITISDLKAYGRTDIDIKHIGGNDYSLDFHV